MHLHRRLVICRRRLTLGHNEISSTACPGTLLADFVKPYRNGTLKVVEERPAFEAARFNFVAVKTAWTEPRVKEAVSLINEAAGERLAVYAFGSKAIKWITQKILPVYPAGQQMAVIAGAKAAEFLPPEGEEAMLRYTRDESDVWDGRFAGELWECVREIESRYPTQLRGVANEFAKKYGGSPKGEDKPIPPPAVKPEPGSPASGKAAIIDRYFASTYQSFGAYSPVGGIIVEEADRAGLALQGACALVEQESGGRNIFGCDHGPRGDSPPYCRQPVTAARVAALRRSGMMNGVGLTQLTWHTFVTDAEELGGAHLARNQLRIGFDLLASYFSKYGEPDGWGAFNAGEANRASVRGSYSASCMAKRNAWTKRLE